MPPLSTPPQMPPLKTPPGYHHLTNPTKQGFANPNPAQAHRSQGLLRPHRRTNPIIWCGAIFCVIFTVLLILSTLLTLLVFLVVKPRTPTFDISGASLNSVYLDSPTSYNGDLTFLANFSNPNSKIDVRYEDLSIELYYRNRLIAAQGLGPFRLRTGGSRMEAVHMISSEVYLSDELALRILNEVRNSKVVYSVRGAFRVRAYFWLGHVSYWVYGRCLIEMTAPPSGILVARSCRTKR